MKAAYLDQKSVTTQDSIRVLYGFVFLNAEVPGFDVSPLRPCKKSFTMLPCTQRKVESVVDRTAAYSHMTSEPSTYWSQIFLTDSELMGQPTQIRTRKWERRFGSVASISQQSLMSDDIRCCRWVADFSPFKGRGGEISTYWVAKVRLRLYPEPCWPSSHPRQGTNDLNWLELFSPHVAVEPVAQWYSSSYQAL